MPNPSMTTVTVNGDKFNAISAHIGLSTHHDHMGLPQMGTNKFSIDCQVDMHDTQNVPYATLQKLFQLANVVTRDKIVPIKIEFWTDETRLDAICTYTFNGWISSWNTQSGNGANHTLSVCFQPALSQQNFVDFKMGN